MVVVDLSDNLIVIFPANHRVAIGRHQVRYCRADVPQTYQSNAH
jgi:hypothetical protein